MPTMGMQVGAGGGNRNAANKPVDSDGTREWSNDLFDCFAEFGTCKPHVPLYNISLSSVSLPCPVAPMRCARKEQAAPEPPQDSWLPGPRWRELHQRRLRCALLPHLLHRFWRLHTPGMHLRLLIIKPLSSSIRRRLPVTMCAPGIALLVVGAVTVARLASVGRATSFK
jgi:hypothetical protein